MIPGKVSMNGGLGGGVWSGRVAVGVASISRRQVSGGSSRDPQQTVSISRLLNQERLYTQ